jgi:hypothetical protein
MKTNYKTIDKLLENPSEISEVMKDPAKYGKDFWYELSDQHKSYVMLAAGAGLLMYGLYLRNQGNQESIEGYSSKEQLEQGKAEA